MARVIKLDLNYLAKTYGIDLYVAELEFDEDNEQWYLFIEEEW